MEVPAQDLVREVGSLLTAERSVWIVNELETLPHGEQRVTTGTGWFYEGVALEECDGELWLVATGSPQPNAPAIPDGPAFFLSLINLVKPPIQWVLFDEALTAIAALEWCTQYGLPLVESVNLENRHRPQLSLRFFQRETMTLALLWRSWIALLYKDRRTLACDLPQRWLAWTSQRKGVNDIVRALMLREAASMPNLSPAELEELAKSGIAELLNERISEVHLAFAWGDHMPRLYLSAASVFNIGYWQMANLLTKPDSESTQYRKQNIKMCQNCGDLFWGHGNRRYCARPQCDRRLVHRHKSKGEQGFAQKVWSENLLTSH